MARRLIDISVPLQAGIASDEIFQISQLIVVSLIVYQLICFYLCHNNNFSHILAS